MDTERKKEEMAEKELDKVTCASCFSGNFRRRKRPALRVCNYPLLSARAKRLRTLSDFEDLQAISQGIEGQGKEVLGPAPIIGQDAFASAVEMASSKAQASSALPWTPALAATSSKVPFPR
jgi:hypothetical protein